MLYDEWAVRILPPRSGNCRALACTNSTAAQEIDNDIFQFSGSNLPGSYGRALMRCHAEGNDIYILFGSTNGVVANNAATTGATVCDRIPSGQEREYEIHPTVDKFFSATTANGTTNTATLRYRITTEPMQKSQSGL